MFVNRSMCSFLYVHVFPLNDDDFISFFFLTLFKLIFYVFKKLGDNSNL